jgi:excisionase family DNA binding protein
VVDQTTDRQWHVPTHVPTHRLLSLAEVANYLVVPVEVVEELVAARSLRALRIGRELRVRPEELEAFLQRSAT